MDKIFISLGYGCQIAQQLKNHGLRESSLPFDWVIPHSGITDIIKDEFKNYLPNDIFTNSNGDSHHMSIEDHTLFPHNKFPEDKEQMTRRINRFIELLKSEDKELCFIKRGHMDDHHNAEYAIKYGWDITNDIDECEELFSFLKVKYPNLKFKIILFLLCSKCYDYTHKYNSENIKIYNVSKPNYNFQESDTIAQNKVNEVLLDLKNN